MSNKQLTNQIRIVIDKLDISEKQRVQIKDYNKTLIDEKQRLERLTEILKNSKNQLAK